MENKTQNPYCNCLYYSATALARIITRMAEEEFAAVQLPPSYAFLLMTVNNHPGIQPMQISKIMMLKPSTVTRLIEKMEFKGYLRREYQGKYTQVYPTKKSTDVDKDIKEVWQKLLFRYEKSIGKQKSKDLTNEIFELTLILQE